MTMEERMACLEAQVERLQSKYVEMGQKMADVVFEDMLRRTQEAEEWFDCLPEATSKYLVILTVKDTPGSSMPGSILRKIHKSGFNQFQTDLWRTYIGVIWKGNVIFQKFHEEEEPTYFIYEIPGTSLDIIVASQSWKQGNRGNVLIGGKDYTVGSRGVNIVIYNVETNRQIDSVGYDSHEIKSTHFMHFFMDYRK